jgi:hypothetical protein
MVRINRQNEAMRKGDGRQNKFGVEGSANADRKMQNAKFRQKHSET